MAVALKSSAFYGDRPMRASSSGTGTTRIDETTGDSSPAELLEGRILDLTRRAARLRLLRSRLVDVFVARKCWTELGFVRLSDYSRERLGIAARTLEDEARVARALVQLPRTVSAFLAGELSWTQVRLLSSVALGGNEHFWIRTAGACDTRSLAKVIAKGRDSESEASGNKGALEGDASEESVRFSVRISRDGRRLWRAASEFAERSAGAKLTQAQILELVAAEAASGAPLSADGGDELDEARPVSGDVEDLDGLRAFPEASRRAGTAPPDCDTGAAAAETASQPPSDTRATPRVSPFAFYPKLDRTTLHGILLEIALSEGMSGYLATQAGITGGAGPGFDPVASRDPFLLDAQLREIALAMQRIDSELGPLLRDALDRRIHCSFGFAKFADYVDARLDFCARKAWTLIAIERAAARMCPELAAAYRDGRLSHLAVAVLMPLIGPRHGAAWIERAGIVTLRRLEAEIAWALDRRDAASGAAVFDSLAPPPLGMDLKTGWVSEIVERQVQMRADAAVQGADGSPRQDRVQMRAQVELHFRVPASVATLAEATLQSLRQPGESRGQAFERMVALALREWLAAPRHRDPIFERDGWQCAVPACRSRRNLHDHHIVFRSEGGTDAQDNRVTVCAAHHLHGLHAGHVRAEGRAPSGIIWQLPFARLLGDQYLDA